VQAIAGLLDGMHLDYALLGGTSVDDPVQKIIMASRNGATSERLPTAVALDVAGIQGRTPGMIQSEPNGSVKNAPARPTRRRD
jgi:hypothetical protein